MPLSRTPSTRRRPLGFTFIELMVAMTVGAILMAIAIPRMAPARDNAAVTSAKQVVASYLSLARQTALRRGGTAVFENTAGVISVTATVDGAADVIGPPVDIADQHGVKLTTTVTSVTFKARGFATPRLDATKKIYFERGEKTDSLCVTILGMIATCGL